MKEIFTDLYNKVLGFFRQTEQETAESAKETACNRLRVVLMQDRTNLTPELMERMRREMVELLSKYVEMDKEALELNLEQDGEQVALMLSIPVIRAKDKDEIADCELRAKGVHGDDESAEQPEDSLNASNQEKAALEAEEKDADEDEEIESDEEETPEDDKDSDEVEITEDEENSEESDTEIETTESEEDKKDEKKD